MTKKNKLNKNNKLVKTFRGAPKNLTAYGDAYYIPPIYM